MRKGEGGREGDGEWWGSRREEGGRRREGDGVGEGGGEEGERQKEGGGRKEGGRRREKGGCGAGDHLFATDCISCKFALLMQPVTSFWCRSKAASSTSTVAVQFPHVHTNLICTSWKASGEETCPFSIQDSMKYQVLGNRTINGDTALA